MNRQKLKAEFSSEKEVMGAFSPERETQLVVDRGPKGVTGTVKQQNSESNE